MWAAAWAAAWAVPWTAVHDVLHALSGISWETLFLEHPALYNAAVPAICLLLLAALAWALGCRVRVPRPARRPAAPAPRAWVACAPFFLSRELLHGPGMMCVRPALENELPAVEETEGAIMFVAPDPASFCAATERLGVPWLTCPSGMRVRQTSLPRIRGLVPCVHTPMFVAASGILHVWQDDIATIQNALE